MFIYNVTISIDPQIEQEWLQWMRQKHISDVLNTNCFLECKLSRVHGEEDHGLTYSSMYLANTKEDYERYVKEFAPALRKDFNDKFQGHFASFRTTLTVVEHFVHGR